MIDKNYIILSISISLLLTIILYYIIGSYVQCSQIDCDTLKNTLYYFFSTNAQVLAAILGIGLAAFYATVTNLRPTRDTIYMGPLYRSLLTDITLNIAVYFGLFSIVLSLVLLLFINMLESVIDVFTFLVALTFISSISSILILLVFVLFGLKIFLNPNNVLDRLINNNRGINEHI